MASIHAITNKVLPEKAKGPLHAAAKAAEFISRQNRNGQAGDGALCDSCLAALRDSSDAAVPLRPTDGGRLPYFYISTLAPVALVYLMNVEKNPSQKVGRRWL